jgi:hypothetical protein
VHFVRECQVFSHVTGFYFMLLLVLSFVIFSTAVLCVASDFLVKCMSHRVRMHRHINRVVRHHLNELSNVKQVEYDAKIPLIVQGNDQDCVPLVIECMEIQNDLIPTELENMMEEVHKTEGHSIA